MRVLIHKDVFDDINLFKEVCDCVLHNKKPQSLTFINDFKSMRFDLDYDEQRKYDLDFYIELDKNELQAQLDFGLKIENSISPE